MHANVASYTTAAAVAVAIAMQALHQHTRRPHMFIPAHLRSFSKQKCVASQLRRCRFHFQPAVGTTTLPTTAAASRVLFIGGIPAKTAADELEQQLIQVCTAAGCTPTRAQVGPGLLASLSSILHGIISSHFLREEKWGLKDGLCAQCHHTAVLPAGHGV